MPCCPPCVCPNELRSFSRCYQSGKLDRQPFGADFRSRQHPDFRRAGVARLKVPSNRTRQRALRPAHICRRPTAPRRCIHRRWRISWRRFGWLVRRTNWWDARDWFRRWLCRRLGYLGFGHAGSILAKACQQILGNVATLRQFPPAGRLLALDP